MSENVIIAIIVFIIMVAVLMGLLFNIYYKNYYQNVYNKYKNFNKISNKGKYIIYFTVKGKYTHIKEFDDLIQARKFYREIKNNISAKGFEANNEILLE